MRIEQIVGGNIRALRTDHAETQDALAQRVGAIVGQPWVRQQVWAAEKGERAFAVAELAAFAVALGVPITCLMAIPKGARVELADGPALRRSEADAIFVGSNEMPRVVQAELDRRSESNRDAARAKIREALALLR